MIRQLVQKYSQRYLPRWIVLVFDTLTAFIVYYAAYALRTNFNFEFVQDSGTHLQAVMIGLLYGLNFLFWGTYKGVVRLTNQYDAFRLFRTISLTALIAAAVSTGISFFGGYIPALQFPVSVTIIHALLIFGILLASRLVVREIYETYLKSQQTHKIRTLIYGAGSAGIITKHTIEREPKSDNYVLGFIDDNREKVGKYIEGVPVHHPFKALRRSFILKNRIREVIISIQDLDTERRNQIVEQCLAVNVRVKQVPSVQKWIDGELSYKQIKKVKIEDLLERDPISFDSQNVRNYVKGKKVMITGAAGSIGSEIARQVLHFEPSRVLLVDQAETPLFEVEQEFRKKYSKLLKNTRFIMANVKDLFRMEQVFRDEEPDIIFHAAAYKHVPLMEENPYEAIFVNVFGTKTIADLAVEHGVEKFVMVSTDKAVNPTNVMGASKRVAEIYTQSLNNNQSTTQFITTRFGNVLGSNGSVIPIFKRQIEAGGPLTLTHKDVKRYFMTIPEACNLVLEAGSMGNGGEIFLFDMGEPVKIYDLACKMIKLSGLQLDKDIKIEIVGLRPGEKLYEELFTDKEDLIDTHHPKIQKAHVERFNYNSVIENIEMLSGNLVKGDDQQLVLSLKKIVPEYRSQNSQYQSLDADLADTAKN